MASTQNHPLTEEHHPAPPSRSEPSLGPSDSSDSASDVAGQELSGDADPNMPVDAALDADARRPGRATDIDPDASDSDSAGTGERRSAAGDGSESDAPDISPDHTFKPGGADEA